MQMKLDSEMLLAKEIQKYPRLPEEESVKLIKLSQEGDNLAREKLIKHSLWIIQMAAKKIQKTRMVDFMDLFQEGYIGLQRSIEKYDPEGGSNVRGYFYEGAQRRMRTMVNYKFSLIHTPFYLSREQKKIRRVIMTRPIDSKGERLTKEEVAALLNLTVDQVKNAIDRSVEVVYLEDLLTEKRDHFDRLSSFEDKESFSSLALIIIKEEFYSCCDRLRDLLNETMAFSRKRREVFLDRYGLRDDWEKKSNFQVAKKWGNTRQNVDQIVKRIWHIFENQNSAWNESWLKKQMLCLEKMAKILNFSQQKLVECTLGRQAKISS